MTNEDSNERVLCYFNGFPLTKGNLEGFTHGKTDDDIELEKEQRERQQIPRYRKPNNTQCCPAQEEKASGVTHLTDNQIREEYGLMHKKFDDMPSNILWVLTNNYVKGDNHWLTRDGICERIGVYDDSRAKVVSACLSSIHKRLSYQPDAVIRIKTQQGYVYKLGSGIQWVVAQDGETATHTYLVEKYRENSSRDTKNKSRKARRKAEAETKQTETTLETTAVPAVPSNINIKINLTVRFLFGLGDDDE